MGSGKENFLQRFIARHFQRRDNLERGLRGLNSHMGLANRRDTVHEHEHEHDVADETIKTPSQELARPIFYAPDMDGQADPGEIVWADIHTHHGETLDKRAVLIIGRKDHTLLAMLISSNDEHANQKNWLEVGSGPWDPAGRESWIRVDKILQIPESLIQRRGAAMPERRYERIANYLRSTYGWY